MSVRELLLSLVVLVSVIVMPACNTAPERDFCGHSVLVVMTQEAGGVNKVHERDIFGYIADQIVEIEDLTYLNNPETALIIWEKWHQILKLTLDKDDKKNIMRVVRYLNRLDIVEVAEPNWYIKVAGEK